jgi:hypothetical protein
VRIGAGFEGGRDDAADVVVVGELGEVHVGEVGGAVQLLRGHQAEDLGLLALTPRMDVGWSVDVGALGVHEVMVVGRPFDSLSIDWSVRRVRLARRWQATGWRGAVRTG